MMKIKEKSNYLKLLFIVFLGLTITYWALDKVSNGVILEVIAKYYTYTYEYLDERNILHQVIQPNWNAIKDTVYFLVIALICLIAISLKYVTDRKADRKNQELCHEIELRLTAFYEGKEYLNTREELKGIEALLLKIKNKEENQIDILEKQTRQKNDLISYLAHDMKTPLASVIGYLNLLNDVKDIPQAQQDSYLEITLDKANRLESLIDEFFDITRFNLHNIVISKGKIEMRFLFEQLRDQYYPILMKQNKHILLDMPEELIYYGDADKLARAFNNILKNAIAYSYQDTQIHIQTEVDDTTLKIYFHNHGDQIPEQKLEMIFEKFYRLDKARSTNSGGAGLGLAIAKEIIQAHDGVIRAESSMEETVFIIELPITKGTDH